MALAAFAVQFSKRNRHTGPIRMKVFVVAIVFITSTILASSLVLALAGRSAEASGSSYSVNGLTCSLPGSTPGYVASLVPELVKGRPFLSATGGSPFLLVSFDNITNHVVTTGHVLPTSHSSSNVTNGEVIQGNLTTTKLPDATELGFATWGPTTSCSEIANGWSQWMDVQVPIQGGKYNLSAESVHLMGGQK
jgi:hypothetical protein